MSWAYAIPSIVSGVERYLGLKAANKGSAQAYRRAYQSLLDRQRIQNEALKRKLDYQTGLAYRGIGETGAVTGMTGAPIGRRSQDVADERKQIEEQNAYQQQLERMELEGKKAEADILRKSQGKSELYSVAGEAIGNIFSDYATAHKQTAPIYQPPQINYTPKIVSPISWEGDGLSNIGRASYLIPGRYNPYAERSNYNLYRNSNNYQW